jgi:hypothetical protein
MAAPQCPQTIAATKGACDSKLLVRRSLVERIALDAVRALLSHPEHIAYILQRVETEVSKLYAHIPESVRLKETGLAAEERRLANFVDFIGEGCGSRTLAQALLETERKVDGLREELDGLRRSREKVFQTPPWEWIEEHLACLNEILERNTDRSGPVLRHLLGQLRLEPTHGTSSNTLKSPLHENRTFGEVLVQRGSSSKSLDLHNAHDKVHYCSRVCQVNREDPRLRLGMRLKIENSSTVMNQTERGGI